jgi:hypothetical protein
MYGTTEAAAGSRAAARSTAATAAFEHHDLRGNLRGTRPGGAVRAEIYGDPKGPTTAIPGPEDPPDHREGPFRGATP